MGSDRSKIIARCCYAAVTLITLSVMIWIAWCLFGLTAVQVSDAQRRAYVNYAPAKSLTSTTTPSPVSSTTLATVETSVNSISKVPTITASIGIKPRKETPNDSYSRSGQNVTSSATINNVPPAISSSRESPSRNDNSRPGERAAILTGSSNEEEGIYARRGHPPGPENRPEEKSDRQKVGESTPVPRYDASSSTRAYDSGIIIESSRRQEPSVDRSRNDDRTATRAYIGSRDDAEPSRRYDIQSSRRSEQNIDPVIDSREYTPVSSSDRARPAYDDSYEDRESGSRYDDRNRRRDNDDIRSPVRDTKVYDDEDGFTSRARDRYPDDKIRSEDDRYDDRVRDRDDRVRPSVRESTRYDDRGFEDKSKVRDDRYRDEGRYRTRIDDKDIDRDTDRYRPREEDRYRYRDDERYRDRDVDRDRIRDVDRDRVRDVDRDRVRDVDRDRVRDVDRYRDRDDDRYQDRGDDRYRDRNGGRYRDRDDDRYRDEDRYRDRDGDKYRDRKDDRYKDDDRYRDRDDDRYTDRNGSRYTDRDDEDRYRYRYRDEDRYRQDENYRSKYDDKYDSRDDERYRTGTIDRKDSISSSRYAFNSKTDDRVADYDVPVRDSSRSREGTSRLPRPSYEDDDKYRRQSDSERRRPVYENDRRDIVPTRTIDERYPSRPSLIDTRPREVNDESRYDRERDSISYDQRDRIQSTRPQNSRSSSAMIDASRGYVDDSDRYQTRLPNERTEDLKPGKRDEVSLDRRSYGSEDEEYRSRYSDTDSRDRNLRPVDDSRRRDRNDESYSRRDSVDDDYKDRRPTDYERERRRKQDRYDDDYRRYDDRYDLKNEDGYRSREDSLPPLPVRQYDSYPDDDERPRRVDPDSSRSRTRDSVDRDVRVREEDRTYSKSEYVESKSAPRRRYDEELSPEDSREYTESRRYSEPPRRATREPVLQPSTTTASYWREPTDVVVREKRFQSTEDRYQSSRTYSDDVYDDRSYESAESSKARGSLRPLSPREVIEAAIRHSDSSDQDSRKVNYPLFDPIQSNMTSPDIIRPNERRGTIISSRKKRFS